METELASRERPFFPYVEFLLSMCERYDYLMDTTQNGKREMLEGEYLKFVYLLLSLYAAEYDKKAARLEKIKKYTKDNVKQQNELNGLFALYGDITRDQTETGREEARRQVIDKIFSLYKTRIYAIANRYKKLNAATEYEDLKQTAYEIITESLSKFEYQKTRSMQYASFLEWMVMKAFQRNIGSKERYVEILQEDGSILYEMEYSDFVKSKREFAARGVKYVIKDRISAYVDEIEADSGENDPPERSVEECAIMREHERMFKRGLIPELFQSFTRGGITENMALIFVKKGKKWQQRQWGNVSRQTRSRNDKIIKVNSREDGAGSGIKH